MSLFDELIQTLPELTSDDFDPKKGTIQLQQDSDGVEFIVKWEYHKPIPAGLKLGK
jgi:hypothetical protein